MNRQEMNLFIDIVGKFRRFGPARNRAVDPDVRWIEVTDDEAVAMLKFLEETGFTQ